MKAKIKGITIEGTPEEVYEYVKLAQTARTVNISIDSKPSNSEDIKNAIDYINQSYEITPYI